MFCNAPPTINPPEAGDDKGKPNKKNPEPDPVPIMFTATTTDNCDGGLAAPTVHSVDCFSFTKKGLRIDRTDECIVTAEGDTITISDSGGVGNFIRWVIEVTDASGLTGSKDCKVEVVNPNN
jgi:hypothetical protein